LVRSVTTREPEWTEEDVAWHTAYLREQNSRCPGPCGLPLDETTDMANGRPVHTYKVPAPARCQACDVLIQAQDAADKDKVKRPGALLRHIERTCDC